VRHEVGVRISIARPLPEVWDVARDVSSWPPMPGADLAITLAPTEDGCRIEFCITAGLPVRDHHGELTMTSTPTGGTELVFTESFRPRIWGTGGYLRGRRERALVDAARGWSRTSTDRTEQSL